MMVNRNLGVKKHQKNTPASVAQLDEHHPIYQKDSWSGHSLGCGLDPPIGGVQKRANICFSLI